MIVTLKKILELAEEKKIAVGAFNACNLASMRAVVAAAEESGELLILQYAQCHECYNSLEDLGPLMIKYAARASVPVCVHLDHGENLDYLKKALELGFTGIMFDGSNLPYEQNLALSAEAVRMAREFGASVEAELGCMGRREEGKGVATGAEDETKIYTDPALAGEFVRDTGIDALACSFGTTHGIYLKKPRLDFDIVSRVRENIGGKPIVMHGGSGVSPEDFRRAIQAGVRKINYFTYMDKAGGQAVADALKEGALAHPFFADMTNLAMNAMKENVKSAIRVFSGKIPV